MNTTPTDSFRPVHAAVLLAAGLALAGCSSDDNLDQFEYPVFPGIHSPAAAEKRQANAGLSGAALAYQAALIYETVLNYRAYDGIERPLTTEPNGRSNCERDGYVYYNRSELPIQTSFGNGRVDVSQVVAYGCTVGDEDDDTTVRATIGQLNFVNDEVPCAEGGGQCAIAYNSYGSESFTYAVQYLTPTGAGASDWRRVQIQGVTVDGPRAPVEVGGVSRAITERRQNLLIANSIATKTAAGAAEDETVVSLQFGNGVMPFVLREVVGVNQLELAGVLSSGSTRAESCTGGVFSVETVSRPTRSGTNLTTGELKLTTGSGSSAKVATLVFQANGDVAATDADSVAVTLTRTELEALRTACFQTVKVKR